MCLIAFGVLVCAYGELNLVVKGLILQLSALGFEVGFPSTAPTTNRLPDSPPPATHSTDVGIPTERFGVPLRVCECNALVPPLVVATHGRTLLSDWPLFLRGTPRLHMPRCMGRTYRRVLVARRVQ